MDYEIAKSDPSREADSRSNYEVFAAAEGILRVTERYEIAPPPVKYGAAKFTLIRSRNTQANIISAALQIGFKDAKGLEGSSFLDGDEIKSVDTALRYISTNRERIIRAAKTYTEVDYSSRGGFRMGLYVMASGGQVGEFMVVGRRTAFLHSLGDLSKAIDEVLLKIETLSNQASGE
jgi:hypothetical protein